MTFLAAAGGSFASVSGRVMASCRYTDLGPARSLMMILDFAWLAIGAYLIAVLELISRCLMPGSSVDYRRRAFVELRAMLSGSHFQILAASRVVVYSRSSSSDQLRQVSIHGARPRVVWLPLFSCDFITADWLLTRGLASRGAQSSAHSAPATS